MTPLPADLPPDLTYRTVAVSHAVATAERGWTDYRVQPGDTLYDLAREHGTTVSALAEHNELGTGRWLMPGQVIRLPAGDAAAKGDRSAAPAPQASRGRAAGSITVRSGDTLYDLAREHGTTVSGLVRANDLGNARMIYPGQRLSLPGAEPERASRSSTRPAPAARAAVQAPAPGATRTVTVRAGDTLSHLAVRERVSLSAMLQANPDLDAYRLWVGARVTVPGAATAPPAAVPLAAAPAPNTFLHYTYPQQVAEAAQDNREALAAADVPSRQDIRTMIVDTARRHGVDPALMLAISSTESGWDHRAVSNANAIGAMQVIPSTGEWASGLVGRELDLLDPQDNITAGTAVMRALLRSADDEEQAIAGYYQGLAGVQRHGMHSDTRHYVDTVQAVRARF